MIFKAKVFLGYLHSSAIETYRQSPEYEYVKKYLAEMELIFRDNLTVDQKELVEECIFEMGAAAERESEVVYRQGLKDSVLLLKDLGVLA